MTDNVWSEFTFGVGSIVQLRSERHLRGTVLSQILQRCSGGIQRQYEVRLVSAYQPGLLDKVMHECELEAYSPSDPASAWKFHPKKETTT